MTDDDESPTTAVVPESKYVDAARKRNTIFQQLLQRRVALLRRSTEAAQEHLDRQRKSMERALVELRLETDAVETNAAIRSLLQRRARRLRQDAGLQLAWTGSRSQQQLWSQLQVPGGAGGAGGGGIAFTTSAGAARARSAALSAASGRGSATSAVMMVRSVTLTEFDRRLAQWRRERTTFDRQTCCVHRDPRYGIPCFVPNVETPCLSGGYHLCLYRNVKL